MHKRTIAVLLIIILLFTATGCWDANEINELGFVLSVALDKAGDGYKVTAQIAKPDTYSKTPAGSSSQGEKEKPFWVISSTGKTIFEAIRNMATVSPRRIFWAHIKVIIIGEELARSNIHDVLDFFTRNPELRLRTLVAVSPGEAEKLLNIVPVMEKDPATDLEKIIDNKSLTGKGYRNMLKNFLEEYLEPNVNPVVPRIMISKAADNDVLKLSGAAVFSRDKLVGWLDERETRGLLWIKNEIANTIMVIDCPYDGQPVTMELKGGTTSFDSKVENGIPHFAIKVDTTATLVEQGCLTDFTDPQALRKLEETLAAAIQKDIRSTLTAAQNLGVDFLGLSAVLHRQHKDDWQQFSAKWPETLAQVTFEINVKADIPSVSLLAKPLIPETEQQIQK